jgi:hypothetical protein
MAVPAISFDSTTLTTQTGRTSSTLVAKPRLNTSTSRVVSRPNVAPSLIAGDIPDFPDPKDGYDSALVLRGSASASLKIPQRMTHLQVQGFVGPRYGIANFSISPPPPVNLTPEMTSLSTDRPWYTWAELFDTPLNPQVNYTLTVSTTPGTAGDGVRLHHLILIPSSNLEGVL